MGFGTTQLAYKVLTAVALASSIPAFAVTCTTQSQMKEEDRAQLQQAARAVAQLVEKGDAAGVKAITLAKVAAQFDGIASGVQALAPLTQGAVPVVTSLFLLDASDLKQTEDETQFFCGSGGSNLSVVFSLQQLPPGKYAVALLHASGVAQPQQIGMIFAHDQTSAVSPDTQWKLAGFYYRPLTLAGRDGIWYWKQARDFAKEKQPWNAYLYYQTARRLVTPVDFMSSPNLDKLDKERDAVAPPGLPGAQPMTLSSDGATWKITNLETDGSFGGLDLVIHFQAQDTTDLVATRTQCVGLMKALLLQQPELRAAFHGMWVFADAPNQRPYAIELPINQIE